MTGPDAPAPSTEPDAAESEAIAPDTFVAESADSGAAEAQVTAAAFDAFSAEWSAINRGIETGLAATLQNGIEDHRKAIRDAGLDSSAPESRVDRSERLIGYRQSATEFLDSLVLHFGSRAPASTVVTRMTAAVHATVESVRALPDRVDSPWPANAMARRPTDGRGRRFKKSVARALGAGRREGNVRSVPVRAVAQSHLHAHLLPTIDQASRRTALEWASWGQELERAWILWADSILALLVRAAQAEERDPETVWAGVGEAAQKLQEELERLAAAIPAGASAGGWDELFADSRARMASDLSAAGGFVYAPAPEAKVAWGLPGVERIRAGLGVLDEGVATRLELYSLMLGMLAGATAVRRRLLERFEAECLTPIRTLRELADEFERRCAEVPTAGDAATLRSTLGYFRKSVESAHPPAATVVPDADVVAGILDGGAQSMAEALTSMVRQSPEELLLTPEETSLKSRRLKVDARPLPFQQLARQSFDVLRIERIRLSTAELIESVERLRGNIEELENVFRFAFESAQEELGGEDTEAALEHAPKLVEDALRNIAESLRQEVSEIEGAFLAAGDLLTEEIGDGALGLIDRVAAGGVQAQVLAAQSRLTEVWAWATERWGPEANRQLRRLRYFGVRARRIWRRGYRAGSRMVAGSTGEEIVSTRTVRLLADAAAMMRSLPPVYQRLFTLEPLSEATFLVGREQELADCVARWRRFDSGEAGALVYWGRPGCGMSSFLNALERQVTEDGARAAVLRPTDRFECETAWTAAVAEVLGLPAEGTLAELVRAVRGSEEGALPQVVVVDNLEHLFLRVPGGVELLDKTLTFMTETETHVLWICGMTLSAWQQVATTAPTAVAQIDDVELVGLDGAGLRAAVTLRHRRSGLPLQYAEPKGKRLLQRRLRKATSPEAVRSVLADDFFEQLARTSSGHLRLALFQWLQSCDFEQAEGLVIKPPIRPDFSALDSLSLTQAFTLKAFLEHRTLTLAEHDRIFRVSRSQSAQILESLMNRRLIAPVDTASSHETVTRDAEHRYQIHGLLVGAVVTHLQGRNIVH